MGTHIMNIFQVPGHGELQEQPLLKITNHKADIPKVIPSHTFYCILDSSIHIYYWKTSTTEATEQKSTLDAYVCL